MARQARPDVPDGRFHVVNRGVDRCRIFYSDEDRIEFGTLLGEAHQRFGITVLAYALMDNHFHLVVHTPDGGLSAAMQHVTGKFARTVNRGAARDGHLFGARFYSDLITADEHLLAAVRYVERNPLDIRGVNRVAEYRWSSHRANAGFKRGPDWLDTTQVLSYFSGVNEYRQFVEREFGTPDPSTVDPALYRQLISLIVARHRPETIPSRGLDRAIAVLLLDDFSEESSGLIVDHLGLTGGRALADARRHAACRLRRHPEIQILVDSARTAVFDTLGPDVEQTRHRAA